ncbi:hypothetical protein HS125_00035 [bacterium]|nr:hypothetical protein [bacterium]
MIRSHGAPAGITFHPKWWHTNFGTNFNKPFYYDPKFRIEQDMTMRRQLWEKFGDLGIGEKHPEPQPIIGSKFTAMGWMIAATLGAQIRYLDDAPPWPICAEWDDDYADHVKVPDITTAPFMSDVLRQMDWLEKEYGYIDGDINLQGVLNVAIETRGQMIFIDMIEHPERAHHIFDVIADTIIACAGAIRERSRSTSIGVTTMAMLYDRVSGFERGVTVVSNCTVEMISNEHYEEFILPYDTRISETLRPFGVHHCGFNLDHVTKGYSKIPNLDFIEIGYGSGLKTCRRIFADKYVNARYGPVKMRNSTCEEIDFDVAEICACRPDSMSVVAVDDHVTDEQVRAYFNAADKWWNNADHIQPRDVIPPK